MAVKLKNVIEGERQWHILTSKVPKNERVVTFTYDLGEDKFVSHAPPSYVSHNGRIVFPGHSVGFKKESLGQFNYCEKHNAAFMMTTKGDETQHLSYFLHRVLRMKKKTVQKKSKDSKESRGQMYRQKNLGL